ncbi:MAG: TetR/AcrR family transcriptional regulator [Sporichthyaceae bacterium]
MATGGGATRARTPSLDVADTLLTTATDLIARDGLNGLTLRALTAAAGAAPSGIYSRFGGMDGLVDAVLVRAVADLAAFTDARHVSDPQERLQTCALAYRSWALAHPRIYEAMFMARPGYGSTAVTAAVHEAITVVTAAVEYAIAAGEIAPGPILEIAQLLWNAAHGAVSLELRGLVLTDDPEYSYAITVASVVNALAVPYPPPR